MAVTVGMLATLPLVSAMASETALAQTVSGAALTVQQPNVTSLAAFEGFIQQVGGRVNARMGSNLVPLTDFAAAGALPVSTINNQPRSVPGNLQLTPVYMGHLGAHVQVLAGQLPAEGLGGDDVAVTMPQLGADQVGLHLSDRFCLGVASSAGGQPARCARIVGLWRPLDLRDPFWGGTAPRLELMATRFDFFTGFGAPPQPGTIVGLRYAPNRNLIGAERAAGVSRQIGLLQRDLAANPNLRVQTSLGQVLDTFREQQQQVAADIQRIALSIGLLALTVVALVFHHLLDSQARSRAELLRQGRSPAWIWSVSLVELSGAAGLATLAGVAAAALVGAALTLGGSGLGVQWLRPSDLGGISAFAVGGIGGIVLIPAELAALAVAVSRESEPPPGGRQEQGRLARWRPSGLARLLRFGGLLTLPRRLRGEISGTLARSQLEQRPEQHAGAAFVLAVAMALSIVFAVELVIGPLPGTPARQPPALRVAPEISLILGLPAALLLAFLGWGIHFRSTAEHRQRQYATLFASALPPATIADSVGAELSATARLALIVGTALGVALLGVLGAAAFTVPQLGIAALGGAGALALMLAGTRVVSRMALRLPFEGDRLVAAELPAP